MAAKKKFSVTCKEQGRGKGDKESFATLQEAQKYIRDRWQGAEYKDGPASFHTDYSTYTLKGFVLADIGKSWFDREWQCFEWEWLDLNEVQPEPVAAVLTAEDELVAEWISTQPVQGSEDIPF